GSQTGWLVACLIPALASEFVPTPGPVRGLCCAWLTVTRLPRPGRVLLVVFAVPLLSTAALIWFAGEVVADNLVAYLPRAVSYVQHGTFSVNDTDRDYLQYFHSLLVGFPMVFLHTDVHVRVLSFVSAAIGALGLAAFCRRMSWGGYLPIVAACL